MTSADMSLVWLKPQSSVVQATAIKSIVGSTPSLAAAIEKEHGVSLGVVIGVGDELVKSWFAPSPPSEMAPFKQKIFSGGSGIV